MTKEIKLPTYEDGTPVCFGDLVLTKSGMPFIVECVRAYQDGTISIDGDDAKRIYRSLFLRVGEFVKSDDSWEQLEQDILKGKCAYYGMSGSPICDGCIHEHDNCSEIFVREIVCRAKQLAGVEDE